MEPGSKGTTEDLLAAGLLLEPEKLKAFMDGAAAMYPPNTLWKAIEHLAQYRIANHIADVGWHTFLALALLYPSAQPGLFHGYDLLVLSLAAQGAVWLLRRKFEWGPATWLPPHIRGDGELSFVIVRAWQDRPKRERGAISSWPQYLVLRRTTHQNSLPIATVTLLNVRGADGVVQRYGIVCWRGYAQNGFHHFPKYTHAPLED